MIGKRNSEDERLKAEFIAKNGVKKIDAVKPLPLPQETTAAVIEAEAQPIYLPVAEDIGDKPVLLWVPVSELHINSTYQRAVSTKRGQAIIKEIVEFFKWSRFQPVTITENSEGGYWVIDGQHRMIAAQQRGIESIPAVLLTGLSNEQQAHVFVGINAKRVTVNAQALHHALVASGDIEANRVKKCCDAAGVVIPKYPKMLKFLRPEECLSIGTLKTGIKKFGEQAVINVLRSIRAIHPNTAGMMSSDAIKERLTRNATRYSDGDDR